MKKEIVLSAVTVLFCSMSIAQINMDEKKLAVNGYDVVNYFTTNSAARGSVDNSATHQGATYYFVSKENLEAFKKNPKAYLPQFGGFCAFAVAKMGAKAPSDPTTFRIDEGKLYLFYNDLWEGKPFNTIIPWLGNEAEMEKMAAQNWKTIQGN